MTFTYNINSLTTALAQVRLEIGDTDSTAPLFADEEIQVKLAARADDVLLTAADLCDVLAIRFAKEFDFETDGQSFKRSDKAKAYTAMSKALRLRAEKSGGITSTPITRVDGYSDDLSTRDGAGQVSAQGRKRHGYYDGDVPV